MGLYWIRPYSYLNLDTNEEPKDVIKVYEPYTKDDEKRVVYPMDRR